MEDNNTTKNIHWVGPKQVQEHFRISKSGFENLFHAGMPCLRIGKSRRFLLTDVEKWLKERHESTTKKHNRP